MLKKFVESYNFTNLSLVKSMRLLFDVIFLPVESQDIIYILEIDYYLQIMMRTILKVIFIMMFIG